MTPETAAKTDALIAQLWQRHLPTFIERLDTLERIAHAAANGTLTEADRDQAANIAHKFAGSLGMYGYPRGTEIAMQLENLYRNPPLEHPLQLVPLTSTLRCAIFPND
ncbi:MAG: Hpt domain-containing protein [Acidobacteriota bacterium]|nr:Hpt domain-containing protein [Acidobacteriota bacterium]